MSTFANIPQIFYVILAITLAVGLYLWFTSESSEPCNTGVTKQRGGNVISETNFVNIETDENTQKIVGGIDEKRKFISGGEKKPEEFLPPKTMENSTEYEDDNCDFYVNHRIGMDTNAYLPRKSKSRTIYQSIAGDVPINAEPVVASRIVSTYNPPSEGFMNSKQEALNAELACPY